MQRARFGLTVIFSLLLYLLIPFNIRASSNHVDVISIKGVINPVMSAYVQRGISQAESDGAKAVILEMDTPGGLDTSMREIIQQIIAANVPVIVYVSPPGSRAASAGLFILESADIAAMAPNTNTGAAHPVGLGVGEQPDQTEMDKVTNDAVAFIRGLALRNGRNADWAEQAVRQSVSVTDQEALQLNVIDLTADNMQSLLEKVDGRVVNVPAGRVTLETRDASVDYVDMDFIEQFLFLISDPNIAYLLMTVAMTGLFLELTNPGAILPGIVGGIALLLAIFAFGMLPVNFVGVLLILFAFLLFLAEVKVNSHGMLTIGGVIALVLGSLMLINSSAPYFAISRWVIASVVIILTCFFVFVVSKAIHIRRKPAVTGRERLFGEKGIARTDLSPKGIVLLEGELWQAESANGVIKEGSEVRVTRLEGLKLWVNPYKEGDN